MSFSGREEGQKKTLLKAYGGTELTEDAVKEGLSWLVRQQRSRGIVEHDGARTRAAGDVENEEAATAMALLAFQGGRLHAASSSKNDPFTCAS